MLKFQNKVLETVSKVPKGKVTTYSEIARAIGNPRAARAIGTALSKNPNPIQVPCHRVVKSNGEIGGYKLGTRKKTQLLISEGVEVKKGKIDFEKYLFCF